MAGRVRLIYTIHKYISQSTSSNIKAKPAKIREYHTVMWNINQLKSLSGTKKLNWN